MFRGEQTCSLSYKLLRKLYSIAIRINPGPLWPPLIDHSDGGEVGISLKYPFHLSVPDIRKQRVQVWCSFSVDWRESLGLRFLCSKSSVWFFSWSPGGVWGWGECGAMWCLEQTEFCCFLWDSWPKGADTRREIVMGRTWNPPGTFCRCGHDWAGEGSYRVISAAASTLRHSCALLCQRETEKLDAK